MFRTEVKTCSLPVEQWLTDYCRPEQFCPLCRDCPDYGRVWSCPPRIPSAQELLSPYQTAHLIGVKLIYPPELRARADTPERTELLRQATYGKLKRRVLDALLCLERQCPGSYTVAAGRCEWCDRCAREEGRPCIHPDRMRYSFSAFGFDLGRISAELLGVPLVWASEGLPEYNMAIYAFLTGQDFDPEQWLRSQMR